jgi:hypothetical protein
MYEKAVKTSPSKRKEPSSDCGKSNCIRLDATEEGNGLGRANPSWGFVIARPRGSKA